LKKVSRVFAILSCATVLLLSQSFAQPVDKQATPETRNLLKNLAKLSGKVILFGHQDDLAYGTTWEYEPGKSDVKSVCGDYPALYGWEMSGIELGDSKSLDSVPFDKIRQFIIEVYNRGGVNTLSWHLRNPYTGGTAWDVSSKETVKNVLPGGAKNQEFNQYLDRLAAFFSSLKTKEGKSIPFIFRPWHEHTGSWFWWGKDLCTTDEYKSLWKYTVEYLCDKKGLHNMLYAYSPSSPFNTAENYMERYPGNNFVDVLGMDIYQGENEPDASFAGKLVKDVTLMCKLARENGKLCALTEVGNNQIPDENWWTETLWKSVENIPVSYMLFWRNAYTRQNHYFVPYPGQISADNFKKFYSIEKVAFQKKITSLNVYK
jgi:mannan endo-1,4-beta-mannosidase